MPPIIKCLLTHRNTASCEECKGLKQCRYCTTEFKIQISRFKATGHVLEITYWKDFGVERSTDNPKWAQHLPFLHCRGFHAAKFSPGKEQGLTYWNFISSSFNSFVEQWKFMQTHTRYLVVVAVTSKLWCHTFGLSLYANRLSNGRFSLFSLNLLKLTFASPWQLIKVSLSLKR